MARDKSKRIMIQVTPQIAIKLSEQKKSWNQSKGKKTETAMMYVCAYCMHRGGTLKRNGNLMVCANSYDCRFRASKLSERDADWLQSQRKDMEKP